MLHQLMHLSDDLRKLWDEGFELEIINAHLLVHHIPYVNSAKEISYGTLVSTLNLAGNVTIKPETHGIYFIGEVPCNKSGNQITGLLNSSPNTPLTETISLNHLFSRKPHDPARYSDYYDKITTYCNIITGPAKSIDDKVTEKTSNFYLCLLTCLFIPFDCFFYPCFQLFFSFYP